MHVDPGFLAYRRLVRKLLLAVGTVLFLTAPVEAATLRAATFTESISGGTSGDCPAGVGGSSIFAPDTIDRNCPAADGFSSGHARTTGGATPSIVLDLAASARTGAEGRVEIVYEFAVVPLPGAPLVDFVPVNVHALGNAWVSKTGEYSAQMLAGVSVAGVLSQSANAVVPFSLSSLDDEDGFAIDAVIDAAPDSAITVTMLAYGEINPRAFLPITGGAEAHAFIDPTFRIASDFGLRDAFRLQFSPGILPAAEVPLPASLWLALACLGACLPRLRVQSAGVTVSASSPGACRSSRS